MYSVNYHRAKSVAEAAKLARGEAKYLSGGMTLIPAMKTRLAAPSDVIDLSHIKELKGIKVSGKNVTIGAATTHFDVANDEKLAKVCPAICASRQSMIGDPRCAIAARSAARSPTTIRRPTIRRRCWRSTRPSSPTSARSRRQSSSPGCSRRR